MINTRALHNKKILILLRFFIAMHYTERFSTLSKVLTRDPGFRLLNCFYENCQGHVYFVAVITDFVYLDLDSNKTI